ncbi:MAG: sigma-70 family RNA polymerase sigma factor [Pirellulaceae bacterium]|nr:sigma-70 family RNA polymerase sigma factor [Pirellulaceae bacterium]
MKTIPPPPGAIRATACAALVTAALASVGATEGQAVEQLQRYCTASWRNARIAQQDWDDCTQQALERLLERVPRQRLPVAIGSAESSERRELNRAVWCTVQRWRRAKRHFSLDAIDVVDSRPTDRADEHEWSQDLSSAVAELTPLQQRVLKQWSEGSTVREIAREMDLPAARVSDQKYKAIRKLRNLMDEPVA